METGNGDKASGNRILLETFLVEWKQKAGGAGGPAQKTLETFLVEWKQCQYEVVLECHKTLKPS